MRPSIGPLAWLGLGLWLVACGAPAAAPSEISVEVGSVALDPRSETPVVVLEEIDGPRVLPIWVGFAEARAIAAELNEKPRQRPGTHDLAKRVIDELAGSVERITVTRLDDGIYYAVLSIRTPGGVVDIDARPSDAIAIALRYPAPIFVREGLLETREPGGDGGGEDGFGI